MPITPTKPMSRNQKGWGYEIWVHNSPEYCGKVLVVYAGKKSSLHYHERKQETFYVKSGRVWMRTVDENGEEFRFEMVSGDVLEIPISFKHQFGGIAEVSEIIEFSTQHFESDTIRTEMGD